MFFNPTKFKNKYRIESNRLKNWDYSSPGTYFVTMCTYERQPIFGQIVDGKMHLNQCGHYADECWREIPKHFDNVTIDEFVIMPDHLHGVITIVRRDEAMPRLYDGNHEHLSKISPKPKSLGVIIGSYKSIVTKHIQTAKYMPVWQRNYYDHIVRTDAELNKIRQYIKYNPDMIEKINI